jgi:CopG family nickel-responsive transcriptional regulator
MPPRTKKSSPAAREPDALVRFGVAMETSLLEDFDALVGLRGSTRSELLRDLARAEITRARQRSDVPAVGTLTLVYDHHVRDLGDKLTEMQHDLGEQVRSTLHVHLDHDHCLEVIVLMGRARQLHEVADRLLATKGVKHGALELVPTGNGPPKAPSDRSKSLPRGGHRHDR